MFLIPRIVNIPTTDLVFNSIHLIPQKVIFLLLINRPTLLFLFLPSLFCILIIFVFFLFILIIKMLPELLISTLHVFLQRWTVSVPINIISNSFLILFQQVFVQINEYMWFLSIRLHILILLYSLVPLDFFYLFLSIICWRVVICVWIVIVLCLGIVVG